MKTKTADRLIRLLTIPVGLMGVYVIAGFFQGIYALIFDSTSEDWWGTVFTWLFIGLFMGSILLGIGGLALHTAIVTWKQVTASRVRRLAALCSVALWGLLASRLAYPHDEAGSPDHAMYALTGIGLLAVCVGFYLIVSRLLIARSSVVSGPPMPAQRHWIGLVCFLFWLELSSATEQWAQTQPQSSISDGPNFWVDPFSYSVPILAAWLLYKATIYVVDRRYKRYEQSMQENPVPVS